MTVMRPMVRPFSGHRKRRGETSPLGVLGSPTGQRKDTLSRSIGVWVRWPKNPYGTRLFIIDRSAYKADWFKNFWHEHYYYLSAAPVGFASIPLAADRARPLSWPALPTPFHGFPRQ